LALLCYNGHGPFILKVAEQAPTVYRFCPVCGGRSLHGAGGPADAAAVSAGLVPDGWKTALHDWGKS
jgi:hypothetical protein